MSFFVLVYWEIPVFIMFWIKFCTVVRHSSVTGVFWSANNWPRPWPCTTDLASDLLTKWKFWQLTLKWLSGACIQDKSKKYYCCCFFFFCKILFNYAIQGKFITWLVNSALNCSWKPISHSSLRDTCNIVFRVQFNAEFTSQVMNFPIVLFVTDW